MRLYFTHTSPYARKVRLVIEEKGLQSMVESVVCDPFTEVPELLSANPLGKVPTLVLDNGEGIYGSQLICAYLDTLDGAIRLIPEQADARLNVLRWEALVDGFTDAAYNIVMERKRNEQQISAYWIEHWQGEIQRALAAIEQNIHELDETLTLAHLALAAGIGYLQLRLPEMLVDSSGSMPTWPGISAWFESFSARPSMVATQPL